MTDLSHVLPSFDASPFAALLPAIERHALSTTHLLALNTLDVARQTGLAVLEVRRFVAAVRAALVDDLKPVRLLAQEDDQQDDGQDMRRDGGQDSRGDNGQGSRQDDGQDTRRDCGQDARRNDGQDSRKNGGHDMKREDNRISTLDAGLDAALGGGIPRGCVTELAGESGAGKTQLLLTLCLAVQLPPPHGFSRKALYISTESALPTQRLAQLRACNPFLNGSSTCLDNTCSTTTSLDKDPSNKPSNYTSPDNNASSRDNEPPNSTSLDKNINEPSTSLDNILSTLTPDLESQDHILHFQVPVLLARHPIGLVVIDSVAANYRAEFERAPPTLAARSAHLVRLGALLRDLARRHNVAVVVANQVADRFAPLLPVSSSLLPTTSSSTTSPSVLPTTSSSLLPSISSPLPTPSSSSAQPPPPPPPVHPDDAIDIPALRFDHQLRWFSGWGDDPNFPDPLKTPSLGLVWSVQISCRLVLLKRPVYRDVDTTTACARTRRDAAPKTWRRWLKVVFAPHVAASGPGIHGAVEFDITKAGLKSLGQSQEPDT